MSEAETPMIEVHNLVKSFGAKYALRGVNLRVMPGQSVVLFGPNGAGKTTLVRILSSLSRPSGGTVRIGGLDLAKHADGIRRYLGVVSHAPLLYDSLTAEENLRFFAGLYGMPHPEERIKVMLQRVGLWPRRSDLVRTFSRGMVQRMAIARALLHDPEVLLLDEPDTGLDPQAAEMLHGLLSELSGRTAVGAGAPEDDAVESAPSERAHVERAHVEREHVEREHVEREHVEREHVERAHVERAHVERARTIVTVTHSIERGLAIADKVVILANGRVAYEAPVNGMTAAEFRPLYDEYCQAVQQRGFQGGGGSR